MPLILMAVIAAGSADAATAADHVPRPKMPEVTASMSTFTDIARSKFRDEIVWMVQKGITSGCTPTRFCPDGVVTRGQFASFITRARSLARTSKDYFRDDSNVVHHGSINSLAAAGLTVGCGDGRYCPHGLVTRAQLATFAARIFRLPVTPHDYFVDDAGSTHEDAINRLASAGLTAGCGAGRFCPNGLLTRGQFAAFLHRALERPLGSPSPAPAASLGIWISASELLSLPLSGPAWDRVVSAAANAGSAANVSDQDSKHDQDTLAAAIYAARTGKERARAIAALESAIGTERGARWLAVGRNLLGYVIAADVLGIRSGPVYDWLASFRTIRLAHNNSGEPTTFRESAWRSGSNASAQEGAAFSALAVYLRDAEMLTWSWNAFRRYAGDRSSPHRMSSNSEAWQEVASDPIGIQNAGATSRGCSIDGAISNDMSRGGEDVCTPAYTHYPWVGLEGAVPAAMILSRAGYPAWDIEDRALRRAAVYLMGVRQSTGVTDWYDSGRAAEIKHLLNRVYRLGYPAQYPVGRGRTIGFTDYTHP